MVRSARMWVAETTSRTGQGQNRGKGMIVNGQAARSFPGAFHRDILQMVFHQLANSRRAVHMWDDLQ